MSKIYIAMYHYVRDLKNSRYPNIKGLDYDLFYEQIRYFKNNFHIISMDDLVWALEYKKELPENAILLTFDDGYIDHYTNVFPILMKEKIKGTFFIPGKTFIERKLLDVNKVHFTLASGDIKEITSSLINYIDQYRGKEFDILPTDELITKYAVASRFDTADTIFVKRMLQTVLPEEIRTRISSSLFEKFVGIEEEKFATELYLNKTQIACMKDCGMHIGVHGYDHYWLEHITKKDIRKDIELALRSLEPFIDKNNWVMNYPYGSYNETVIEVVKSLGCKAAMTTEVAKTDVTNKNRYSLQRFDTNDFPPKSSNYMKGR